MKYNYLRKILLKCLKYRALVLRKWHLFNTKVQCFISEGTLTFGDSSILSVPLRCDGKGTVSLGDNVAIGYAKAPKTGNGEVLIQARKQESIITIGHRTVTSNNISIVANQSIAIGSDCLIGDGVFIIDSDFHNVQPDLRRQSESGASNPVVIGDNVWLGSRVMVMKGVEIGDNSVVAAGAVVVKPVPENVVVAGVPAKLVKRI